MQIGSLPSLPPPLLAAIVAASTGVVALTGAAPDAVPLCAVASSLAGLEAGREIRRLRAIAGWNRAAGEGAPGFRDWRRALSLAGLAVLPAALALTAAAG